MLIHRLTEDARIGRYTPHGDIEYGNLFTDENGTVRWVSVNEQIDLEPVGPFMGGRYGHNVYTVPDA